MQNVLERGENVQNVLNFGIREKKFKSRVNVNKYLLTLHY